MIDGVFDWLVGWLVGWWTCRPRSSYAESKLTAAARGEMKGRIRT